MTLHCDLKNSDASLLPNPKFNQHKEMDTWR